MEIGWEGGSFTSFKADAFSSLVFASPFFVSSLFTFRYPDEDVDSRSCGERGGGRAFFVLSRLVLSCLVLSCLVGIFCLGLACLVLTCLALS